MHRYSPVPVFKLLVLLSGLLFSSHSMAADSPASSHQQYGSYVILGQTPSGNNFAIARTVIDEAVLCPTVSTVEQSKSKIPMITRDNPNHFSVVVCEALISYDTAYQINFSDKAVMLPVAKSNPQTIHLFGDTGCKSPKPGKKGGCGRGEPAEPFKSLADSSAELVPDLVLHVGDFNYRGTSGHTYFSQKDAQGNIKQVKQWPYDAGDGSTSEQHCEQTPNTPFYSQSALNSNYPDIWRNWHDDLFKPAKKLMQVAPWLVTRGNHELCSRAGAGYFYFLAPQSNLIPDYPQISCPVPRVDQDAIYNTVQVPSYKMSFQALDIVIIDSANACDSFADSPFLSRYQKVFQEVTALTTDKPTWLMGHRPIWGITKYYDGGSTGCTEKNQYGCVNQMMQKAIKSLPNQALPESINLVLAGHMHRFQSVSFTDKSYPPQIIVGSSGVALDSSPPAGAVNTTVDGKAAQILSTNNKIEDNDKTKDAFAYMTLQLGDVSTGNAGTWNAELVNPPEKFTMALCSSQQDKAQGVCEFAEGISAPE